MNTRFYACNFIDGPPCELSIARAKERARALFKGDILERFLANLDTIHLYEDSIEMKLLRNAYADGLAKACCAKVSIISFEKFCVAVRRIMAAIDAADAVSITDEKRR